ncbi:MAG: hypothetical protein LC098_01070 [Burkholderiales bacterium]|nr:hypothetical protein [Burkholderiales bacterium]
MTDQRNPSSRKRRPTPIAVVALALLCTSAFVLWAQRGLARCDPPEVSPGGSYEVVECRPLYSSYDLTRGALPRFVKFRDRVRKVDLGSSGIVDLAGNGQIIWPSQHNLTVGIGWGDGFGDDLRPVPVAAPDGR